MKIFYLILLFIFPNQSYAGFPPMQVTAKLNSTAQEYWVTKDVGLDTNDGSRFRPFKTIGAAITAANTIAAYYKQVVIHIAPVNNGGSAGGSYNENISLTQQGVNLVCAQQGAYSRPCVITGTLTVNLTGTSGGTNFIAASNEVYLNGLVFTSGASDTVTFSGTTFQRLIAMNCYFQAGAARAAVITNTGTSGGSPSEFRSYDTIFENNSASIETARLTAGRFWFYGTTGTAMNNNSSGPSVVQDGASNMDANLVQFTGQYQLTNNTAVASFNLSTISSGTASCISTPATPSTGYALIADFGCNSSNTNSITGSGVVINGPGNIRFGTSGDIASTVTQISLGPGLPQGELLLGPGSTTGTNVMLSIKDGHIKQAQTTAATATVNANAGTGATCTVSNAVDGRGRVTITAGTAAGTGTMCTLNFNKTYGVAPVCLLTPKSAGSAANLVQYQVGTETTSGFPIAFNVAPVATTVYTFNYSCGETQ